MKQITWLHLNNLIEGVQRLFVWLAQRRWLLRVSGILVLFGLLTACAAPAGGRPSSQPSPPVLGGEASIPSVFPGVYTQAPSEGEKPSPRPTPTGREGNALTPSAFPGVTTQTQPSPPGREEKTVTSSPLPTLDAYAGLSIDELAKRSYGGGKLEIQETLAENSYFTRTLIRYPSDSLQIYGFMNTPREAAKQVPDARYPVIIALHGYIDPAIYQTVDYTTRYADSLARAGFLVIHPNLRGYPPSDDGDNRFRVGMAIDVLNLIAIIKDQAGKPGPLENADAQAIGLWGHSMGGGVATRVLTVSPDVDAAVLYGAMSGDELKNYERIFTYFSNGTRGVEELQAPENVFVKVSPINYLERIRAAVSIHHGKQDPDVPLAWSIDMCQRLKKLGISVECFTYADQAHTFHGDGDDLFVERAIEFFNKQLRPR